MKASSHQITTFYEVFRARSISRAAARLGVTQSAATQNLAKLERIIGATLFVRHRRGLEPTKAAFELFVLAERLHDVEQMISERLEAYTALSGGNMTIIANAPRPAMPLIAAYGQKHPGVHLSFALMSWTQAVEKLNAREVDIAIITEPETGAGLYCHAVSSGRFMAVLRKDHPLAARRKLTLPDLAKQTVILPEAGSLTRRVVAAAMREAGLEFSHMVEMATYPVVKEAVLHGLGVGILLAESIFPSSELVERPIAEIVGQYRTFVVTTQDKKDLRLIRSFLEIASP